MNADERLEYVRASMRKIAMELVALDKMMGEHTDTLAICHALAHVHPWLATARREAANVAHKRGF